MNLSKLLLGAVLLIGFTTFSQETEEDKECLRMRFLAGEELKMNNYPLAAMYYLKGEKICGGYDAANYKRLVGTLINTINKAESAEAKKSYTDTILGVYDRMEKAGLYDQKDDLTRAAYYINSSKPDNKKADTLFRRGIDVNGVKTREHYVTYFYYNTYVLYAAAKGDEQVALKKRLISEYFELSNLVSTAGMSAKTQNSLTGYFNYVVRSCDDILPDLKGYIENLPEDVEVRKLAVKNFIQLLEEKECTSAPEYETLVVEFDRIDQSIDSKIALAKLLVAKKQYSNAVGAFRTALDLTEDTEKQMEIKYNIAVAQLNAGQYTSAYNTAMAIQGANRGQALVIAATAVATNANNCGASTFERQCNYIYAVDLLEKAASLGASTGGRIGTYKNNIPTKDMIFDNGSPKTVTIDCYGVTVSIPQ